MLSTTPLLAGGMGPALVALRRDSGTVSTD
jgi:hypothetical protein